MKATPDLHSRRQINCLLAPTSLLQKKVIGMELTKINWMSYFKSQVISEEEYEFIVQIDSFTQEERDDFMKSQTSRCAEIFFNVLGLVSKEETLQYVLVMIDNVLQADKSGVDMFKTTQMSKEEKNSRWTLFLSLLNRNDGFIVHMTSRIISKIACWSDELMCDPDLTFYLVWLRDQLKISGNEYMQSVVRCLQMMLRIDEYRVAFVNTSGITTLVDVLSSQVNVQVQYQLLFCLWVMTFNEEVTERMSESNVIPVLVAKLKEDSKQKITRIILSTLRNLLEKPRRENIKRENSITMIKCKVLKLLDVCHERHYTDPDIMEDMEYLCGSLTQVIENLSSFEEYCYELKSGSLYWSPVHTCEKFWEENIPRFNEKNYEMLKCLLSILEASNDPLLLSVAIHDIAQYVRYYNRGRQVIEELDGKYRIMRFIMHSDVQVQYYALLCCQRLMLQNWEYMEKILVKKKARTLKYKENLPEEES